MEVSKFTLELDEWVIGACDVAGTAGSGAHAGRALNHGAYYLGMLTRAGIIVRTPDHDVACAMNARLYLVGACTGRSAGFSPTSGASATSSAAYLHVRLVVALGCPLGREGEIAEIDSPFEVRSVQRTRSLHPFLVARDSIDTFATLQVRKNERSRPALM